MLPLVGGHRVSFVKQKPQNHMAEIKFEYRAIEAKHPSFGDTKSCWVSFLSIPSIKMLVIGLVPYQSPPLFPEACHSMCLSVLFVVLVQLSFVTGFHFPCCSPRQLLHLTWETRYSHRNRSILWSGQTCQQMISTALTVRLPSGAICVWNV